MNQIYVNIHVQVYLASKAKKKSKEYEIPNQFFNFNKSQIVFV